MADVLNPKRGEEESEAAERSLRPANCAEFIGQADIINQLQLAIEAARGRGEALDHVLLFGPPGLGKTTLANIIAAEMGGTLKSTSGPVIERKDDLAALLTDLRKGDVLFIDEIHRLNRVVEECLYPAVEDFKFDILIGEGAHAKSIKLSLEPFTLVGATTRTGMLSAPLRTRFGLFFRLGFYNEADLKKIILRSAGIIGVPVEEAGAIEIARRARGTPRIANRLLRRVRDWAQVRGDGKINAAAAHAALDLLQVDSLGLDPIDRLFLETLIEKFAGGPVGINTLAVATGETEDTIMDVVEPYLIQIGFLQRTTRGRLATARAFEHLGRKPPSRQTELAAELFESGEG
ncbi:Holliday junction branch migration DNA helicase RuvB [Candidatus Sumerlaeota bacterium]|nr:Holliday junction branch migration DNA helicase RuvB [Candidatus Sumerlaeota bacterium]